MNMEKFCKFFIYFFLYSLVECRNPRSAERLTNCVRIAEPLIHEPTFVFPLTSTEIRRVCERWDEFVDCIRNYTREFLTQAQQEEFNTAINPSMQSIHQLCIQDQQYEKAYLYYAPCMKRISIESTHCGDHYNFLASIAESTTETGPAICCGYHKFRTCVLKEASRECDRDDDPTRPSFGSDSTHFVSSMLNRALGFLLQKCSAYQPTTQDCISYMTGDNDKKKTNILSSFGISNVNIDNDLRGRDGRLSDFNPVGDIQKNNINTELENNDRSSASDRNRPNPASINNANSYSSKYKPPITVYPETKAGGNPFTWTTSTPSFFPTRNSTFDFSNHIRGPESQEFRGGSGAQSFYTNVTSSMILLHSLLISLWICFDVKMF